MKKIINRLNKEAEMALYENEVPISCVISINGIIIASSHNQKIAKHDPLAHAEVLCIKKAAKKLKTCNLKDCELFVTLKPCNMCQEIIKESRIKKVFYFVDNNKIVNNTTDYVELELIAESPDFKEKIVNFFKDKR